MIKVISEETKESIENLFGKSESSVQIVSPFLSVKTAELLCNLLEKKGLECTLVTRIYLKDLLEGVNSIEALSKLLSAGVKIYSLQGLHAKIYMFDEETVIIGSANFTVAGVSKNFELSILTDESDVVTKASFIIDNLIDHCENMNGVVDDALLQDVKIEYEKAYKKNQKDCGYKTVRMFGAERLQNRNENDHKWKEEDCLIEDKDPVFDLISDVKKKETFNHSVWAKFEGRSDERQEGNELPSLSRVLFEGKKRYIVNFRNRPRGIQTGDAIFIVSLTNDENGKPATRIVGRGKARAYISKCTVLPEWIKDHPWMNYYRYFCEIEDVQLLNVERMKCLPLQSVYDALDKRTYTSTIDKDEVKNMSLCQCRRSHIQMTPDAKDFIDEEIDKLANQYGFIDI